MGWRGLRGWGVRLICAFSVLFRLSEVFLAQCLCLMDGLIRDEDLDESDGQRVSQQTRILNERSVIYHGIRLILNIDQLLSTSI